ncbi:hypothetical protein [Collimonas humicola]|uniref:hypothetical protein n=1 Tax=Collimonas humicola TaxID=2825886 RepID=UPI001B8C8D91|nr:hypothetical protein [Collimonas humicola]
MADAHHSLTLQLLEWIAQGKHPYSETIDVWKTSCPRFMIWEDACADGLVDSRPGKDGLVSLTAKGAQLLSRRTPA